MTGSILRLAAIRLLVVLLCTAMLAPIAIVVIASFSGLAWRYYRTEERYELRSFQEKSEYRLRATPKESYFHWIELVHPDPDKTLILHMAQSEAGMRERLESYSRRLDRPILASRVETAF